MPNLDINTSIIFGVQDVKEKNLVDHKPDFHHLYYENIGDRGIVAGLSISCNYNVLKRITVDLSSSFYHRLGFSNLKDYYNKTNRDYIHNFILIQPKLGFKF